MKKETQRNMISSTTQARPAQRLGWALAGALLVPLTGQTAAVNIADAPLFASSSAAPNIMFLIDNSGSMSNIVPDTPYNAATTYDCPSSMRLSGTTTAGLRVSYNGYPYIRWGSDNYDWGTTSSGNGPNNYAKRCFDPTANYNAALYANAFNDGSGTANDYSYYSGAYLDAQYSGNYLNWYFGTNSTNSYGTEASDWGTSSAATPLRKKDGTKQRMEIAKEVITSLADSLSNVRAGVSTYNGSSGAKIMLGCKDIGSGTQRADMKTQVAALSPSGSTPLAESLHQIGRYFVGQGGATNPGNKTATGVVTNGQYDGNLTLHPGKSNQTMVDDDTVFNVSPVYNTGVSQESPIAYFCQKNFVIIVSDGRPQNDQDIPAQLQDYDGDCTGASPACLTYDRKDASLGYEYESAGSDYLDDVAMALYEVDLRPDVNDLKNNPVVNNLATYMIGFADDQVMNDPLIQDTAENGGGLFFVAANAAELKTAFEKATQSILDQVGTAAAVSFNTGTLSANTFVYLSQFNSTKWSGDLLAFKLDAETGAVASAPTWQAMSLLEGVNHASRKVITYRNDSTTRAGVSFEWASLSDAQKNDLRTSPTGTLEADTVAQARLNFIRGDRSNEGKGQNFRIRSKVLGDIVHGGPVYVGTPELNWPSTTNFTATTGPASYSEFRKVKKDRTPVVYVGANDGMLHGFHGNTGSEMLAYIPSFLASTSTTAGLHYLTNPNYQHKYYVDMPATVSDVILNGAWQTVLVGAAGAGGKGIYALNITDPDSFGASNVLWEFSSADDADLGLTFSRPMIARLNNGKWGAIVGNGYNATSEHAVLFVLFLDANLTDKTWNLGTDYIKISTSAGVTLGTEANGMSTPGVVDVVNKDKIADRVYAGDLYGNLWAFDISASNAGSWASAYKSGSKPAPLFAAGSGQAITAMPVIVKNKEVEEKSTNKPNALVMFGTGRYLTEADKSTTTAQYFYGVWDSGTGNLNTTKLVPQTYLTDTETRRVISNAEVDYGTKYGWYVALTKTGERSVTDAVPRGSVVFFTTIIPSSLMCDYGGSSWLMALSYGNGGRPDKAIFDVNGDKTVDDKDLSGGNVVGGKQLDNDGLAASPKCLGNNCYIPTSNTSSGDEIEKVDVEDLGGLGTGRISWQELLQ